jgi:ring-1,2-phenylacetyl-CoA epoxidase subunit PaaE
MKPYKVTKVIRETADVVTLWLADEQGGHPNFTAGQYVTVCFPDLGIPEGKAYSLSSIPGDQHLAITVKKIGVYSSRLHELKVGDELLVSEPYGFLNPEFDTAIVAIAGGVGISPLLSIIRDTFEHDSNRRIDLWYSNRTTNDIVFADILKDLSARHQNFRVQHFITQMKSAPKPYKLGRIDIAKQKLPADSFYFVCGRESFVGDIWHALVAAGVAEEKIATETFY